jgi:hypothetical protein
MVNARQQTTQLGDFDIGTGPMLVVEFRRSYSSNFRKLLQNQPNQKSINL